MIRSLYKELLNSDRFSNEDDLKDFLKSIKEEWFYYKEEKAFRNALKKLSYTKGKVQDNSKYYRAVAIFNLFYGFSLDDFTILKNDFFSKNLVKAQKNEVHLYQLGRFKGGQSMVNHLTEDYKAGSKKFLAHIKKNLYVYDYLERFSSDGKTHENPYTELHEEIFREIEEKLFPLSGSRKPAFEYARFLVFPSGTYDYRKNSKELNQNILISNFLKHCPLSLFKHICRCLYRNESYSKSDILSEESDDNENHYNNGFYLVAYPIRKYHYAVMNDGAYCLTEYYYYDRYQNSNPDLLFVEGDRGALNKLADSYIGDIDDLLRKLCFKVTIDALRLQINKFRTETKVENEIKDYEYATDYDKIHKVAISSKTQKVLFFVELFRSRKKK